MHRICRIQILKPGLQTSMQDFGRTGWQAMGVPPGGAMDGVAHQTANWLVGNGIMTPTLEMTLLGPAIQFYGEAQIAITGADMTPTLDGSAVEMWSCLDVDKGSTLHFDKLVSGARAYLAIGGKWSVENWLGSCSILPGQQSILPANHIRKGTTIEIEATKFSSVRKMPQQMSLVRRHPKAIRLLPGPEYELFADALRAKFIDSRHIVDKNASRMGLRLLPSLVDFKQAYQMISSGVMPGTIQITRSGQPIMLGADGPTTGGYFRIAQVVHADLHYLGQLKPGSEIHFAWVTLQAAYEASSILRDQLSFMQA